MSVQDILLCSTPIPTEPPTPAPTLAPTTPTLYDTMPINMKTLTDDSTWQSICYDGVDTFAAIRRYKNNVSFSKSPIAGESWFNANTSGEALDPAETYTSITGNAGTFIITLNQANTTAGLTVIQRLKYNPDTDLYEKSAPIKTASESLPSTPTVKSTVSINNRFAYCSAYGNGVFVVGGYNWLAYSKDDGITWTLIQTTYDFQSIVYGEAKTTSGTRVPRFMFTTSVGAPNETVGYCTFSASKDLTITTTQVTGTRNGKVAYADGIFMVNTSTSNRRDFLYTEDLKTFETGPQLPNPTNTTAEIIRHGYAGLGNIVGAGNYFIVVPGETRMYMYPADTDTSHAVFSATSVLSGVLKAISQGSYSTYQRALYKFDNEYVYRLSTTRTSAGWTAAWESIPLTYSSEELVENWPVVSPETDVSVYGRSGVGPYRAICYGKGKVLAPRFYGDKLTIIDPTVT